MTKAQTAFFWLFICLLVGLTGFAVYNRSLVGSTQQFTLIIEKFEPKELITENSMKFQLNYGVEVCKGVADPSEAHVCLEPRSFSPTWPENCARAIRGLCKNQQFISGIERFYVRKEQALPLAQKLSEPHRKVGIAISVTPNGLVKLEDLLIDGQPWQNSL